MASNPFTFKRYETEDKAIAAAKQDQQVALAGHAVTFPLADGQYGYLPTKNPETSLQTIVSEGLVDTGQIGTIDFANPSISTRLSKPSDGWCVQAGTMTNSAAYETQH